MNSDTHVTRDSALNMAESRGARVRVAEPIVWNLIRGLDSHQGLFTVPELAPMFNFIRACSAQASAVSPNRWHPVL